jgi:CubicO group peptidase (beta-lactamase class C family)
MRFLVILIIFISNAAQSQGIAAKIDSLLTAYYNQDQFSGTVLVAKDDQVIFEKGYGYANREANIPNKPETEYRIGSISKTFTATLIMKLQEIGLLSVSDPVSRYIPDYPKGDSILLFHLLNHTSGIRSITSMPQYYKS